MIPRQNNIVCNACGTHNSTGSRVCDKCGVRLLDYKLNNNEK